MIQFYYRNGQSALFEGTQGAEDFESILWIDILDPTQGEVEWVRQRAGVELPSHRETEEIEVSSRLYEENGMAFMTATIMIQTDTDAPAVSPVTFIYMPERLVTLRFSEPRPFQSFASKYGRQPEAARENAQKLFGFLMDEIVDRLADILESAGALLNSVSAQLFRQSIDEKSSTNYADVLAKISRTGELTANARESLVSLARVVRYYCENRRVAPGEDPDAHWAAVRDDIASLSDHATFLSTKVNFFLDAALGRISIEQNTIIKLFSVAAVFFLPPTLIASIYGMNFHQGMPELNWAYGYPFSVVLMIASAVVTYFWFKRKKWL